MANNISELYKSGDWSNEKHVPKIVAPEVAKKGEMVEIKVSIGEDDPHPNTYEHYISWIKLYFQPEGSNFPVEIGTYDFAAHGEYEVFSEPHITAKIKADESGTIMATSYCNIHGLWENSQELKVE